MCPKWNGSRSRAQTLVRPGDAWHWTSELLTLLALFRQPYCSAQTNSTLLCLQAIQLKCVPMCVPQTDDEPDKELCYGKRCTANEHCCQGSVCVNVDGGEYRSCSRMSLRSLWNVPFFVCVCSWWVTKPTGVYTRKVCTPCRCRRRRRVLSENCRANNTGAQQGRFGLLARGFIPRTKEHCDAKSDVPNINSHAPLLIESAYFRDVCQPAYTVCVLV